jgi:hypothetical protein
MLANGNKAANGFEALKDLDTNNDGKVDSSCCYRGQNTHLSFLCW